jgi:hypothetical protein
MLGQISADCEPRRCRRVQPVPHDRHRAAQQADEQPQGDAPFLAPIAALGGGHPRCGPDGFELLERHAMVRYETATSSRLANVCLRVPSPSAPHVRMLMPV